MAVPYFRKLQVIEKESLQTYGVLFFVLAAGFGKNDQELRGNLIYFKDMQD